MTKIDPSQAGIQSLVYSTYLGGSGFDRATAIAVDESGNAYVTGNTIGFVNVPNDFPFKNPLFGVNGHVFVTKLNAVGTALIYSTTLGSSSTNDVGKGIAVDPSGSAYVVGQTQTTNFPTVNPFQATIGGSLDAFIAKIDPNAAPVAVNDAFSVDEDNVLNVSASGVLANDSDVDADPLTAVLVTSPSSGTLTLSFDGSFTYTPNADFNGSDLALIHI